MNVVCDICNQTYFNIRVSPLHCHCGNRIQFAPQPIIAKVKLKEKGKPGTELKALIPKFFSSEECNCNSYATKMDAWGIEGCVSRYDEIVNHLIEQATKIRILKYLPSVNRYIAKTWLTTAIDNAKAKLPKPINNDEWFIAITTSPRKDCTLEQCVQSMRTAGWEPTIFAEPDSTVTDALTIQNERKKGVWHNWLASARYAIEKTNAKLILTVQDDSLFHPDSRTFTESVLWPHESAGFLSLYTPRHYSINKDGSLRDPGINRIYTRSLWGSCALVWPREVLAAAIETPIAKHWMGIGPRSKNPAVMEARRQNPSLIANSDAAIGRIVTSLGKSMWFVDPSPVSHIAVHSTIKHGGNHGNRNCFRCADHSLPLTSQVPVPSQQTKPKISICVPLKITDDKRLHNWNTVYSQISKLATYNGWEFIVAEHGGDYAKLEGCERVEVQGEFTRAKARNAAWRASSGDIICFLDSDILMSNEDWVESVAFASEVDAYTPCLKYSQQDENGQLTLKTKRLSGGIFFCKRHVIEKCRGWDERFEGWGSEDNALDHLLENGNFSIKRHSRSVTHLYHSSDQRISMGQTMGVFKKYYKGKSFNEIIENMP